MPDSNLFQTLLTAAEAYLALSYSVIPVWGMADPARPKVAGIEWSPYQRRRPTLSEIHQWFSNDSFGGLAIVTGSISRLVVLDFDTQDRYQQFRTLYPDLAENHVVQTRRGFHIYYHLPAHLRLPSRKGQGIDLLSDGRYVIARPTSIDGHTYKLIRGGQPKTLTQFDIERITRFLDNSGGSVTPNRAKREFTASPFNSAPIQSLSEELPKPVITPNGLREMYQRLIAKGTGRNETLFQVSLKARDTGWTMEQTAASLTDLHVWQAAAHHQPETPAQRYTEARKTVQSAFSRPPRQQKRPEQKEQVQIPNSVREYLFKRGETRTVRALDGLRLTGIKPSDTFTRNQALESLKGIVGRDSVDAALKATTQTGEPIFARLNPCPTPPTPANAASNTKTETNKCLIGRAKKSGISPNHRPEIVYIMPSNDELCCRLGVQSSHSDPLTLDDLATAKQTRQAAHRELIRRRPGHYPRRWLARRLGVSCKSLDTYNSEIEGLHSRPCYWEQRIYWSNLGIVPDGIEVDGAFLEDETRKRFPARRSIAAWLLGQGKHVVYKRQDVNYYWYGEEKPPILTPAIAPQKRVQTPDRPFAVPEKLSPTIKLRPAFEGNSYPVVPPIQYPIPTMLRSADLPLNQPASKAEKGRAKKWSPSSFRKPLKNSEQEGAAQQIYATINGLVNDEIKGISLMTSRRLAATYNPELVLQALKLVQTRRNIRNPAGFLITTLRSESKSQWRK